MIGLASIQGFNLLRQLFGTLSIPPPSGVLSGKRFGYQRLRRVENAINRNPYPERVLFGTSRHRQDAGLARRILDEAFRRTGWRTNAVTARTPQGETLIVFRNRNVTTAEVMEELRHLGQIRSGVWHLGFEAREIEAGAFIHRLYTARGGFISEKQYLETIANVSGHTGLSPEQVIRIFRAGVRPAP